MTQFAVICTVSRLAWQGLVGVHPYHFTQGNQADAQHFSALLMTELSPENFDFQSTLQRRKLWCLVLASLFNSDQQEFLSQCTISSCV